MSVHDSVSVCHRQCVIYGSSEQKSLWVSREVHYSTTVLQYCSPPIVQIKRQGISTEEYNILLYCIVVLYSEGLKITTARDNIAIHTIL